MQSLKRLVTWPYPRGEVASQPAPTPEPEAVRSLLVDAPPTPMTADDAAAILDRDRVVVLRRALDPDVVRRYGAALQRLWGPFMTALGERRAGDLARTRNEWHRRINAEAGLAPYGFLQAVARSPLVDVVKRHFGTPDAVASWLQMVSAIGMFAHNGPRHALPFHQDGGGGGGLMLRAWILLYPETAGDVAAGVEFLPSDGARAIMPIESAPVSPHYAVLETSHRHVSNAADERPVWSPIIRLGDVVLFTGDCLHRTRFPASVAEDRFAVQASFYAQPDPSDACTFTRDGVLFPTDDTVAAWGAGRAADAFTLIGHEK